MTAPARRGAPADEAAHAALVAELRAAAGAEVIASLVATGEVHGDAPELVDAMLRRYLAAEKLAVPAAAARLAEQAAWRAATLPAGRVPEAAVRGQIAHGKVCCQSAGGSPALWVRVRNHACGPGDANDELEPYILFCLELAARLADADRAANPDAKLWAVLDLAAIRLANLDRRALAAIFRLLNARFPERVRRIFMLDSPLIFDGLWRIVAPFIDPVTRSKVQFVYGAKGRARVLGALGAEIVPHEYGGGAAAVEAHVAARRWFGTAEARAEGAAERAAAERVAAARAAGGGDGDGEEWFDAMDE